MPNRLHWENIDDLFKVKEKKRAWLSYLKVMSSILRFLLTLTQWSQSCVIFLEPLTFSVWFASYYKGVSLFKVQQSIYTSFFLYTYTNKWIWCMSYGYLSYAMQVYSPYHNLISCPLKLKHVRPFNVQLNPIWEAQLKHVRPFTEFESKTLFGSFTLDDVFYINYK